MKHKLFTTLLVMLMSMAGSNALAQDYDVSAENDDGITIYYKLINEGSELEVVKGDGYSASTIRIPTEAHYNVGNKDLPVTSIGDNAFEHDHNLTKIHVPNSVTSIGNYAFNGCLNLCEIDLPYGITRIGDDTFADCSSLTEISIPNSVTSIGNEAFKNCNSLTSVNIPNSVKSIGSYAFHRDNGSPMKLIVEDISSWLEISFSWDIGDYYLYSDENTEINNLVIPSTVTSIGAYCFNRCKNITSVELPNSLEKIGESAFEGCSELTSVNFPYGLKEIGSFAFKGCALSSINIPNSVTHVGYGSFGDTNIESFYLPESVINIGGFNGDIYRYNPVFSCHKLKEIIVSPNNTKYDSRNGFNGIIETSTGRLISVAPAKNIVIPGFVKTISFGTFAGNGSVYDTSIDSVIIEEGVESIEQIAIYGVHLKKLVIPFSMTNYENSFIYSSLIDTLDIANIRAWCENPIGLSIEATVKHLYVNGKDASNLVIPQGTTKIRDEAFANIHGITSITIPSSVIEIHYPSILGLNSVTVEWETPISITSDVFPNRAYLTLYVPRGCKAAYEAADYWKDFKEIKEYGDGNATITMGSSGIMTYSNNSDLNFTSVSGLKAYIGSGYNPATGDLTMTRVYEVPAGEGLILKGAANSYEVPYEETSAYYANLLVGVPTATTVSPTDGSYTNFILANDELKGIGFYPLASAGEIGANKAYLQLPTSILPAASRSLRMVFEDEEDVTGINSLNDKLKMINDKAVYDLQGRRVVKPTRGLYIKDGKKIMVK